MSMQIWQSRPFVGFSDKIITANLLKYCKLAIFSCDPGGTSALKPDLMAFEYYSLFFARERFVWLFFNDQIASISINQVGF